MQKSSIEQSFLDIAEDFNEVSYLFSSTNTHLLKAAKQLRKKKKDIPESIYLDVLNEIISLKNTYTLWQRKAVIAGCHRPDF